MKGLFPIIGTLLLTVAPAAAEEISLVPPSAYDRSSIYVNLALFWATIVALIVLIRLKLAEIERVQSMETNENGETAPLLD